MVFVQITFSFLAILVVMVGWRVIYNNARRLACRSEAHSHVMRMISSIEDIEFSAIAHWSSREKISSTEVQFLLGRIMALRSYLSVSDAYFGEGWWGASLAELRSVLSLDIEYKHTLPGDDLQKRMLSAHHGCGQMKKKIIEKFIQSYSVSF